MADELQDFKGGNKTPLIIGLVVVVVLIGLLAWFFGGEFTTMWKK